MELRAVNAIPKWRALMGPTDTIAAKQSDPSRLVIEGLLHQQHASPPLLILMLLFFYSIRAICGTDKTRNAVHGSDSAISAAREIELVFGTFVPNLQHTYVALRCLALRCVALCLCIILFTYR
jgi:hypothetical protein